MRIEIKGQVIEVESVEQTEDTIMFKTPLKDLFLSTDTLCSKYQNSFLLSKQHGCCIYNNVKLEEVTSLKVEINGANEPIALEITTSADEVKILKD